VFTKTSRTNSLLQQRKLRHVVSTQQVLLQQWHLIGSLNGRELMKSMELRCFRINYDGLKTLIGENENSGSVEPRPLRGQSPTQLQNDAVFNDLEWPFQVTELL